MFMTLCKIQTAPAEGALPETPNTSELERKVQALFDSAMGAPLTFGIKPRKFWRCVVPPRTEFDFGLDPKAYLYPLHKRIPEDTSTAHYENRLFTWYATTMKPIDEVWSLSRIETGLSLVPIPEVLGITNVDFTIRRGDGK